MTQPPRRVIHHSLTLMHGLLTWVVGWWAFVLALPGDTFSNSRSYELFPAIMTENHWSAVLTCVTIIGLAGAKWQEWRLISAWVLSVTHGVIAGLLFVATPNSTGGGVYAALAVLALYHHYARIKEAKVNGD